jgi:hypothetical protein
MDDFTFILAFLHAHKHVKMSRPIRPLKTKGFCLAPIGQVFVSWDLRA